MRYFFISGFVTGVSLVLGAPAAEKCSVVMDYNVPFGGDVTILNYALTLEYLERKFYMQGLTNYSQQQFIDAGFPDPFYSNLQEIYYDEQAHVNFLLGALGDSAVNETSYTFPSTDPKSFVALASVLEALDVSAYLGAAAEIANKAYLTIAGSILTVESRHSSYLRTALMESPFPKPFDTPLDFNQVYSLAVQFITSSPGAAPLPFQAFPSIKVQYTQYPYTAGASPVTFNGAYKNALAAGLITSTTSVYAVFFSGLDVYYVLTHTTQGDAGDLKLNTLPGIEDGKLAPTGQVYVVLSTADGVNVKVSDSNTISGVGIIEVDPVGDSDGVF